METRIVPLSELSTEDELAWRELAARAVEPNPFFEPPVVCSAVKHFPSAAGVVLLVAHRHGRFLACMPLRPVPATKNLSGPAYTTRLHDEEPPPSPIVGIPLLDPDHGEEAVEALLLALRQRARKGGPGLLEIERLRADGPAANALRRQADRLGMPALETARWDRAVVDRSRHLSHLNGAMATKVVKEARRLGRRLSEAQGGTVVLVDRSGEPDAIARFTAMEAAGWKGRAGTAPGCRPNHDAYFRDMCEGFGVDGRLQVFSLEVDGRPVAMKCDVGGGEAVFGIRRAYDEAYAQYAPGVQLDVAYTDHFLHHSDVRWFDPAHGPAYNDFYSRLFSDHITVTSTVLATGGLLERTKLRTVAWRRSARRRAVDLKRRARSRQSAAPA